MMFIFIFVVCVLPSFLYWRQARRERIIAEARLDISSAVLEMHKMCLNSDLINGSPSHDRIFSFMSMVQEMEEYPIKITHHVKETEESRRFSAELKKELKESKDLRNVMMQFIFAYYKAYRNRHPFTSTVAVSILYTKLLFIGASWIYVKTIIHSEKFLHKIKDAAKREVASEVGAISFAELHHSLPPIQQRFAL